MYVKVSDRNIGWELDIPSNGLRDKRRGQREGLVNVTLTDERDDMSACQLRGKRATRAVYRAKAPGGQAEGRKHSNSISELIGQTQPIPSMHRPRFSSGFCCSVWPLEMGLLLWEMAPRDGWQGGWEDISTGWERHRGDF